MEQDLRQLVAGLGTTAIVHGNKQPYINFDNAASTPPFASVMQTVNDFMPWYSSVHRGNGLKSRLSTEAYEQARDIIGRFVGANTKDHVVIFGKNTTEAINKLSYRLGLTKKDIVLISHLEHHSNDLPWRAQATVMRIGMTPDGGVDVEDYKRLLRRYRGQIKLVAITGASNVTGHLPDIHLFARLAHGAESYIFVDCAQLAAHRPIRMHRLDNPSHLDFIALSAHKMYAPFGSGALVGRRDVFTKGEPEYRGGGTIQVVTTTSVDWAQPPDRDEAGSPNVVGAIAMARAAQTLSHVGFGTIQKHEAALVAYALEKLRHIPTLRIYGDANPSRAATRSGVIPLSIGGMPCNLVAAILGYEWGIGVRSGCFCAQPYVASLMGLSANDIQRTRAYLLGDNRDMASGLVRVSFGLYNTTGEIDILAKALTAIADGEHGKYSVDKKTGAYTPLLAHESLAYHFSI